MEVIELIVPCYNEEQCVIPFANTVGELFNDNSTLNNYKYHITFIDDGSSDSTLKVIKSLCETDNHIGYISFSRNFGKEAAIYAGLENSFGDYVVLLDADLQHPPEIIPQMLEAVKEEGYDCATARRVSKRKESAVRRGGSNAFYRLFSKLTGLKLVSGSTDFRLMKRAVVQAILAMPERERFTKGIYQWIGFKNKWIEYVNVERVNGTTKWSARGLFKYAFNGFIAFATTPLRFIVYLGLFVVLAAFILSLIAVIQYFRYGTNGSGFATLWITMLFLGGVIITSLGIIGEYMARIYMEVKNRPLYIVRDAKMSEVVDDDVRN